MTKLQINKFIDEDELDLSLQDLKDIPIKEISKYSNVTSLDLSCNTIEIIPNDIGLLKNIKKLDFSKNKIKFLPEDISELKNLEYLDIRSNNLSDLPLNLHKLTKLKWLDLKDNPLNNDLKLKAGQCLNSTECENCAKNVLCYLKELHTKKLKSDEKHRKKAEEKEYQKVLEERKLKEQKRIEIAEERARKKLEKMEKQQKTVSSSGDDELMENSDSYDPNTDQKLSKGSLWEIAALFGRFTLFGFILFLCSLVVILVLVILIESCSGALDIPVWMKKNVCGNITSWMPQIAYVSHTKLMNIVDWMWRYMTRR